MPFTVIGVTAEGFAGTFQGLGTEMVFTPMAMYPHVLPTNLRDWPENRRALIMSVVGRLKPGVTIEQANASLATIATRLRQEYPEVNEARSAAVSEFTSLFNPTLAAQFALIGGVLMTIVGLVLMIACVNVANLMLARAATREREISVRLALGAGRHRLVRQLLTESLLLALAGGAAGLLLAFWGRVLLWSLRPADLPQNALNITLDHRVFGFTLGVSLLTGVIFGLIPALQSSRPNLTETLHEGGRAGSSGARARRLRSGLVVAEITLALVALIGAGLFVRSMQAAQDIDPGFETERMALMFVNPQGASYEQGRTEQFYRELLERAAGVGGVESVAISSVPPLGFGLQRSVMPEGQNDEGQRGILTVNNVVSPGYFDTMTIGLLRGRDFTEFDTADTQLVAIINEEAQRRFWPDQDPIGKRFQFITEDPFIEIVGVVKDTLIQIGQPAQPIIYLPFQQRFQGAVNLLVHTTGAPEGVLGDVQNVIRAIDRNMPITNAGTIQQTLDQALWAPRVGAGLLGIFGTLALALAMVGIYGVMAYAVSQRTHEIGIRMALGAGGRDVLRLVVKNGMTLVAIGVGLGLLASLAVTRLLTSLLFDISTTDPLTFVGVTAILVAVAMVANYLPARRVMRVDPVIALRAE